MKNMKALALFAVLLFLFSNLGLADASKPGVMLSNKPASPDWSMLSATWTFVNGRLDGSGVSSPSPKIVSSASFPSDRTFSVKFKTIIQGTQPYYTAWMVGKYVSEFNRTVLLLSAGGGLELAVSSLGTTGLIDNIYATQTTLNNLAWHSLTVVYTGNTAQVSVDGVTYLTVTDPIIGNLGACRIELASWGNSESQFSSTTISF
jgi:hypothetical protein